MIGTMLFDIPIILAEGSILALMLHAQERERERERNGEESLDLERERERERGGQKNECAVPSTRRACFDQTPPTPLRLHETATTAGETVALACAGDRPDRGWLIGRCQGLATPCGI